MEFAKNIKQLRTKHNISQEQLADKLHIARQSISKWERGEAYPNIGMLIKLSDMFDVSVDELLKNDEQLKTRIVKDGERIAHPRLKALFDWIFVVGLTLIVVRLSIYAWSKWADVDVPLMSGGLPSLIPLALMLIGGIGSDTLKKDIKS